MLNILKVKLKDHSSCVQSECAPGADATSTGNGQRGYSMIARQHLYWSFKVWKFWRLSVSMSDQAGMPAKLAVAYRLDVPFRLKPASGIAISLAPTE